MARTSFSPKLNPTMQALRDKKNVINAVILRDMRTRFFNHGLGFLMVPLWAFVHMGIVIAIHAVATHGSPAYGDSASVFFMTGLIPFLSFIYVSRFMGFSLAMNRAMLAFPIVKVTDILIGRAFLEILASFFTICSMIFVLWVAGQNSLPFDLDQAVFAYLATILLAFGVGFFIAIASMFIPMLLTAYQLTIIALYASSGVFFVASDTPDQVAYFLSFNPLVQCIEWMRCAYYQSYSDKLVNPVYILSFGIVSLLMGLAIERYFRRKALEG